jgi:hypothetical protein
VAWCAPLKNSAISRRDSRSINSCLRCTTSTRSFLGEDCLPRGFRAGDEGGSSSDNKALEVCVEVMLGLHRMDWGAVHGREAAAGRGRPQWVMGGSAR